MHIVKFKKIRCNRVCLLYSYTIITRHKICMHTLQQYTVLLSI